MGEAPSTILAIDLGTSGPKVALCTTHGRVLGSAKRPTPLYLPGPGAAEQKPAQWWSAIVEATRDVLGRDLAPASSVVAVNVTAQWAGTVPVDADGEPLHDAVIWMDTRGREYVRRAVGGLVRVEGYGPAKIAKWIRRSGGAPGLDGKDPVGHILFLREKRPEVYAKTFKFLEPKDYLNLRLTGQFAASYDSITLHWSTDNRDIERVQYDDDLLRLTTLPRDKLPDLRPANAVLGPVSAEAAAELGIPETAEVRMGTPDVHSATIGSGAVRDFEAHVYLGTSSWVACHVPFKKTDIFRYIASLPAALPGRYVAVGTQDAAGACIEWLRDGLLFPADGFDTGDPPADFFARLEETAGSVPAGSDKVIFTPWLFGERMPEANPTIRASFCNLTASTTRAHLVRAILEGVAFNTRWLLEPFETFIGRRLGTLRVIGGGANSTLWCQILADVLDRNIAKVRDPVECNARGAALLASVGRGDLEVAELGDLVDVEQTFRPNAAHRPIYDELYRAYRRFYKATRGIYADLNA